MLDSQPSVPIAWKKSPGTLRKNTHRRRSRVRPEDVRTAQGFIEIPGPPTCRIASVPKCRDAPATGRVSDEQVQDERLAHGLQLRPEERRPLPCARGLGHRPPPPRKTSRAPPPRRARATGARSPSPRAGRATGSDVPCAPATPQASAKPWPMATPHVAATPGHLAMGCVDRSCDIASPALGCLPASAQRSPGEFSQRERERETCVGS